MAMRVRPSFFRTVRSDRAASIAITGLLLVPVTIIQIVARFPLVQQLPLIGLLLVSVSIILLRYAMIARVFTTGTVVNAQVLRVIKRVRSRTATLEFGYSSGKGFYQVRNDYLLSKRTRQWQQGDTLQVVVDGRNPERAFVIDAYV